MGVLCTCMSVLRVCAVLTDYKRAPDPLGLELQTTVSLCLDSGSFPSPEIFVLRLFMLVIRIGKKHQFLNLFFISAEMNL